jgi:hypothetical protein
MTRPKDARRRRRAIRSPADPFVLVSGARDGLVRIERFKSATAYRRRLMRVGAKNQPVSLAQLIDILERSDGDRSSTR